MSRLTRLLRSFRIIILAFFRLFASPKKAREFFAYVYLYDPFPYTSRIRCVTLPSLLNVKADVQINLRKCFPRHGNMTGEEVISIALLVRWFKPKTIFEFGTFDGNTTLQMTLNAPEGRVFTLNLPSDHGETLMRSSAQDKLVHPRNAGSGSVFRGEPEATRIIELFGDSASFDFRPYLGQCDFVLVDAGHEYQYVKSDTLNALKLLPPEGGLLIWHDFPNAPGVCKWLEEFSAGQTIFHIQNTRLAFTTIGRRLG